MNIKTSKHKRCSESFSTGSPGRVQNANLDKSHTFYDKNSELFYQILLSNFRIKNQTRTQTTAKSFKSITNQSPKGCFQLLNSFPLIQHWGTNSVT